jgi:hypothetical protein
LLSLRGLRLNPCEKMETGSPFYSDFKSGINRSQFQACDRHKFPFFSMNLLLHRHNRLPSAC